MVDSLWSMYTQYGIISYPNKKAQSFDWAFKTWLPETNQLRTIPIEYDSSVNIKVKQPEKTKHIIHKAVKWKQMLDNRSVESMIEVARIKGLTRARVTQIMNLMKLPTEMQVFLLELDDAKQVRKHSEKRLRGYHE